MLLLYRIISAFLRFLGLNKKVKPTLPPIPIIPTIPDLVGRFKDNHFITRRKYIHATHYGIKS